MRTIITPKIVITAVLVLTAGAVVVSIAKSQSRPSLPDYSSTTALRIDLVQSVEETGSVTAELEINYGFEKSGQVAAVNVAIGDTVTPRTLLASLENTRESQELLQAKAGLSSAIAALQLKISGVSREARSEALAAVERSRATLAQAQAERDKVVSDNNAKVSAAENTLQTAEKNLRNFEREGSSSSRVITEAYENAWGTLQSAIVTLKNGLKEADNILGIDNTQANDDFEDGLGVTNQDALVTTELTYSITKNSVTTAEKSFLSIKNSADTTIIDTTLATFLNAFDDMATLLSNVSTVLGATLPLGSLTQTTLDTKKTKILTTAGDSATARRTITTAIQNIDKAENSLSLLSIARDKAEQDLTAAEVAARSALSIADANVAIAQATLLETEAAYDRLIAPPRDVDLAGLRAEVSRARAILSAAERELEKTAIRIAATGTIARIDIELGETVAANIPIIKSISDARNIKVDISESEISKVTLGDPVEITLDAFGDEQIFMGSVTAIEPAETEISGVIHYKTTILFEKAADEAPVLDIRPGMTANVRIITAQRDGVITIPERALLRKDGVTSVRVLTPEHPKQLFELRPVTPGIKGDDGKIEIKDGLRPGEEVITFIKSE